MNPLWNELAERAGLTLLPEQHKALSRYLELLFAANQTMNLTRIVDILSAETQHIGDALTVLPFLPPGPHRLVDVGTGGGVPGIPLAIARPDVEVLLVEATRKKAVFLRGAIAELGLTNVRVDERRAEDVGQAPERREQWDVAIARAVATMPWLAEWLLPLVKRGGKVLAMKGPKATEELPSATQAIKLTGGGKPMVHPVVLPGTEHRVIVEIAKVRLSGRRFPRPPTEAKGRAL